MADPFHANLKSAYGELTALYEDARIPVDFRQDWQEAVIAHRFLGSDVRVHAWRLAESYLLTWSDWEGNIHRYLRYFGRSWDDFPERWRLLHVQCESLTRRMFGDAALGRLVSDSWLGSDRPAAPFSSHAAKDADSVAHEIVVNHGRICLLAAGHGFSESESGSGAVPAPAAARHAWQDGLKIAWHCNDILVRVFKELPPRHRSEALAQLRFYRRRNLLASWLLADWPLDRIGTTTALLHILKKETPMTSWIDQAVGQLQVEARDGEIVRAVLQRITTAISDFSYDEFIGDVGQANFRGGQDSPVGSDAVNLIPSSDRCSCRSVLLACSKGEKKKLGFTSIMRQVREHLINCQGTTRIVIFLCDTWTKTILDEHIGDLRAHHRKGVRFLFLQAISPGKSLTPLPVDLTTT